MGISKSPSCSSSRRRPGSIPQVLADQTAYDRHMYRGLDPGLRRDDDSGQVLVLATAQLTCSQPLQLPNSALQTFPSPYEKFGCRSRALLKACTQSTLLDAV